MSRVHGGPLDGAPLTPEEIASATEMDDYAWRELQAQLGMLEIRRRALAKRLGEDDPEGDTHSDTAHQGEEPEAETEETRR